MPPQQQAPTPNPDNPYDFILNAENNKPKSRFGLPGGSSMMQRILLIVGLGVFLLIAIVVLASILGGGSSQNDKLITIAQEQTEIIRIADMASTQKAVKNPNTLNFASNVSLSVNSSRIQTIALLTKGKSGDKVLGLKKNSQTDAKLKQAIDSNNYDEVFLAELKDELKAYRADLLTAFKVEKNNKTKQVIKTAYDGTNILLGASTDTNSSSAN